MLEKEGFEILDLNNVGSPESKKKNKSKNAD